jgi:hypothetical protein
MRYISLIILLLLGSKLAFSQHNIGTTYCEHNDLNAARYQPSELDFGNKKFQIGFNYDFWTGNQSIDYYELNRAFRSDVLTQEDLENILETSRKVNRIGTGQNYQVIGIGYQLRSKNGKKYDLAFSVVDRFSSTIEITESFLKLAFEGNNTDFFRGNMGTTKVKAFYLREFAVNIAMPLYFKDENHRIRLGIRPKLIQGLAAVNPESSNIFMTTQAQGEFIQTDFDYNYQTSGTQNFDPFTVNGRGFGIDLGLTGVISKHFEVVASLLDVGAVKFDKNTVSYKKQGVHDFDGIFIPNLFGVDPNELNFEDELSIYNPQIVENESFTMGLGSRFGLEFQYKTPEKPRKKRAMTMARNIGKSKEKISNVDESNISNTVYFTYIQGMDEQPGNTTRPFFSVGYMHDFHDYFDIGVSAAYGGFNNLALGTFFAVNIAHSVKFGLSSDNIGAIILPRTATGFDISTNFSVSF